MNLIEIVKESMENANLFKSKITDSILNMEGMSGKKTRHFYNNICSVDGIKYLEIGTWIGSTICSAMCKNKMKCVCIDNWSEFGGPKKQFFANFNKFKGENDASFIEKNCWDIDVGKLGKFNVYMYDGHHKGDAHYKAIEHFKDCMEDEFIFIVDDWNWLHVRKETLKSIYNFNLEILYETSVLTTTNDKHPPANSPPYSGKKSDWHNGICVFVLKK